MRESGYVANMSRTIQIAARLRAATFPQLRKKILKDRYFLSNLRESGFVAATSRTIQIAARLRAATFLQLRKNTEKPLFFALEAVGKWQFF